MSRIHILLLLGLVVGGIALVVAPQHTREADGFTDPRRGEIVNIEFRIVMGVLRIGGESTRGMHYHPGGESGFVPEYKRQG